MGCDIHWHAEVKINGQWHHYATRSIGRDYDLFAKMAGVRNYNDISPIAQPRGLPNDVSALTKFDSDYWDGDGHSHSWLSATEIAELVEWQKAREETHSWWESDTFGYLFGNDYSDFIKYPDDNRKGLEDVRFVFWFDN